eukprot:12419615-Prorocentrum_lima.AAC.1
MGGLRDFVPPDSDSERIGAMPCRKRLKAPVLSSRMAESVTWLTPPKPSLLGPGMLRLRKILSRSQSSARASTLGLGRWAWLRM